MRLFCDTIRWLPYIVLGDWLGAVQEVESSRAGLRLWMRVMVSQCMVFSGLQCDAMRYVGWMLLLILLFCFCFCYSELLFLTYTLSTWMISSCFCLGVSWVSFPASIQCAQLLRLNSLVSGLCGDAICDIVLFF